MDQEEKSDIRFFNEIFSIYRERYIRFAYSYTYNQEVAEDLVTESLMYYWENRAKLRDVRDVPLYVLVIVKNRCLDYLQRQRTWGDISEKLLSNQEWELQMRIAGLEACDPETLFRQEIQDLITQTLEKLPEKTRRIFRMSRYEGKSYPEIADIMGLSVKSIEFHISKALRELRINLKDYLPLSSFIYLFDFFCK